MPLLEEGEGDAEAEADNDGDEVDDKDEVDDEELNVEVEVLLGIKSVVADGCATRIRHLRVATAVSVVVAAVCTTTGALLAERTLASRIACSA